MGEGIGRRGTYFAFQGLLAAILILYLVYHRSAVPGWQARMGFLAFSLAASFAALGAVSRERLENLWFSAGLFLVDALLASLILLWTASPQSDLYLTYFLILLGTTLTRNYRQSIGVAAAASLFYLFSAWDPETGLPAGPRFWLRIPYLWIMAAVAAAISLDARRAQTLQDRRYRRRLLAMERLAAVGRLAGEVAHRLKGPLSTILVNSEILAAAGHKAPPKLLEQIQESVAHCRDTLSGLLDLGRADEARPERMNLSDAIKQALDAARADLDARRIRLETLGLDAAAAIVGDRRLLFEAFAALIQNAVEAMPDGGILSVELRPAREGSFWTVSEEGAREVYEATIRDTGAGVAAENISKLFEPFFTTKRGGNGLGLSAALRILQSHGGSIEARSPGPGRGAVFTVLVPRQEPAAGFRG